MIGVTENSWSEELISTTVRNRCLWNITSIEVNFFSIKIINKITILTWWITDEGIFKKILFVTFLCGKMCLYIA